MQDILDRIWENSSLMKNEREKQPERFFSYWQPAAIGLITFSASILVSTPVVPNQISSIFRQHRDGGRRLSAHRYPWRRYMVMGNTDIVMNSIEIRLRKIRNQMTFELVHKNI